MTEAPGHQKSDNQAHVSVSFDELDLVFFVVNQLAGVVFCFALFSRKRGRFSVWRNKGFGRYCQRLANFRDRQAFQLLNQIHFTRCKQVDNGGTEFTLGLSYTPMLLPTVSRMSFHSEHAT